ncbi:DUF3159 domain-containing protein [Corynebacterium kefirresidentii]|uniref:DUF3159 domain-containing protein n=1 Tax=Corynebacterium kefirresidentii TaxID=1979527 RepID=A0ABT8Q345_9CORY|nr:MULTISPECIES: DUF3159 domain-containing protein [Corynebacterium]MCG7449000.1 DUF3159 domain-containing protein [Corynebacterium kefirresidentii]MCG7451475.1 DUF3159 domain-containing protein [Corynebacterium kefirresidentii]MDN8619227.1 DUF3159 domain-containing protein [Corynebacterium kefirresidentii]MDN8641125.1 DUF3159 domain-containing protein [Corynebacterium kefirresidentii]MDU4729817.1 DUF3159 domain-containing protein [Corynebacterium sp.]
MTHSSSPQSSQDAKNLDANESQAEPTLLEQMGGLSGLVSATLPVLVLIPVNNFFGLGPALAAALGVAVAIAIWRVLRKETLQPAISGLLGVALCAAIAWFTGDAKGYFLYGIWMSLALCIAAVLSILFRWPAVGVIWKGINGEEMQWQKITPARRAYAIATGGWAVIFLARFIVQRAIYDADATTALGVTRILMGWPLTLLVTALTVWMVRRADTAVEEATGAGERTQAQPEPLQEAEVEND